MVSEFMEQDRVVFLIVYEFLWCWHSNKVARRRIEGFAKSKFDCWLLRHCINNPLGFFNRRELAHNGARNRDLARVKVLTLRHVENRVLAQHRNFVGLAVFLNFQPFPEHDWASFLALTHIAAKFLRLLEREPIGRSVGHRIEQKDIYPTIYFLAD